MGHDVTPERVRELFEKSTEEARAEWHVEQLLTKLVPGFDVNKEQFAETPKRYVKMMKELCEEEDWNFTTFEAPSDNMVVVGPLPFYTLCAHHVVPFFGRAFVGYVPDARIAGLSKFPRAVQHCAKGLWDQESLTARIATYLETALDPKGIAVMLEAEHMCMAMRGIKVANAITVTAEMRGVFGDHSRTAKAEFLEWIRPHRHA